MVTENMVKGLDEDESHFLDECSRQQSLVEKQWRDEEKKEVLEYRISFMNNPMLHTANPMLQLTLCYTQLTNS